MPISLAHSRNAFSFKRMLEAMQASSFHGRWISPLLSTSIRTFLHLETSLPDHISSVFLCRLSAVGGLPFVASCQRKLATSLYAFFP